MYSFARNRNVACRFFGSLCLFISPAAVDAYEIVSIEEHWELHVGGPDVDSNSPQISMVMSPTGGLEGDYFVFTLNHGNVPGFTAGGMQVQHWYDEEAVDTSNGPQLETLSHNDETISWTQKLSVNNGTITFEILDGSSQTWNVLGGQGYLKASVSTAMETLNSYRPAVSIT